MPRPRLFLLIAIIAWVQPSIAEFRLWSDSAGESVEAEFVRMQGDKVILRKRDNAEVRVGLDLLTAADQRYAMLQEPPNIGIKVSDKTEKSNLAYMGGQRNGSQVRNEAVNVSVELRKTSTLPYSLKLKLEVILIGKIETLDRYVLLQKTGSKFEFNAENKGVHTHTCRPVDLRQVTGSRQAGRDYEGYLVAVRDEEGKVIVLKASRTEFEKNADAILAANQGTVFDRQFTLVSKGKNRPRKASQP